MYALQHKNSKKLATLSFSESEEYGLNATIGSCGDAIFVTENKLQALTVLSISPEWYNSDAESPTWSDEETRLSYELVEFHRDDHQIMTDSDPFPVMSTIINKINKDAVLFANDPRPGDIDHFDIDHTLTDKVDFPDKISYDYMYLYCPGISLDEVEDFVGQIMFMDNSSYSLVYVHAAMGQHAALKTVSKGYKVEKFCLLLVSRIKP